MGNLCCGRRKNRRKIVLLLLGLDNAGKTVAVKQLAGEDTAAVVPTIGFSVVDLKYSNFDVSVYDLGGRPDFRDIWPRYFVDAYGIIFVIDSSDYDRLDEAQTVLMNIVSNEKVKGKPILLLANKQDSENALDEIDLIEKLELETLANENECPTLIQTCCANNPKKVDKGIQLGFSWLMNCIIKDYNQIEQRVRCDVERQEKFDQVERYEKMQRIKYLNEQEAKRNEEEAKAPANGVIKQIEDVFIVKNTRKDVESIASISSSESGSSTSTEPIVYYELSKREDGMREALRPKSATNLVRRQLQLDNLKRRTSLHFGSNRSTPLNIVGGVKAAPKSATATIHRSNGISERPDRRHLRSAGDSVFIVSDGSLKLMPNQDGSGDLSMFGPPIRNITPKRQRLANELKEVLPPVSDVGNGFTIQNGNYF